MKIDLKIDTSGLKQKTTREVKRLAYSTAQAINKTALSIQTAQRVNLDRHFKIRKAGFMYRLIKVTFANVTKDRAYAEIAIDNTKSRVLLSIFEGGGEKQPFKGQNVAVPITGEAARPSFGDPVQDAYTFKNLNFKKVSLTQQGQAAALLHGLGLVKLKKNKLSNNAFIWEGDHRTFILPHSAGAPNGGVFQRIGPGRDDVRMIYSFKRDPKLKKMLGFVDLANEVYQREFTKNFMDAYNSGRS